MVEKAPNTVEKNSEQEHISLEAKKIDKVQPEKVVKHIESTKTPEQVQWEKKAKNVFDFIVKTHGLYFDGMYTVKDQDKPKALAKFSEVQMKNVLQQYNDANPTSKIDNVDSFLTLLDANKPEKIVGTRTQETGKTEGEYETSEQQKVGEFLITDAQKQKISTDLHDSVKNYDLRGIVLIGIAEGTGVSENGDKISKDFIAEQLQLLSSKGFDISKLPSLESQKQLFAQEEQKNPGNVQFAYGRAIMQISHLSPEDLKLLSSTSKVTLDLRFQQEKGDDLTQGGVVFEGHASKEKISAITQKIDTLLNQWKRTNFEFKYTEQDPGYANGKERKPVAFKMQLGKELQTTQDSVAQLGTIGAFKIENYRADFHVSPWLEAIKPGETKVSTTLGIDTVYVGLPDTLVSDTEVQSILKKDVKTLSFPDVYALYSKVAPSTTYLDTMKKQYDEYQTLTADLQKLLQDKKLN